MPSNDNKKRINATDGSKVTNCSGKNAGSKNNHEDNSKKRISGENGDASKKAVKSKIQNNQKNPSPKINSPQKPMGVRSPIHSKPSASVVTKSMNSVHYAERPKPTESIKSAEKIPAKPKSLKFEESQLPDVPTTLETPTALMKPLASKEIYSPEPSIQVEAASTVISSTSGPKWALLRSEEPLRKSLSIYDFHGQRSTSAIDLKHYKQGHYVNGVMVSSPKKQQVLCLDVIPSKGMDLKSSTSGGLRIMTAGNGGCYYTVESRDSKSANLRVFSTIMLNAWRKRRSEVKELMCERDELKKGTTKSKNQLHVMTTLYRMESKRNDELRLQLKSWAEEANLHKTCCEDLKTAISRSKAENEELKEQLQQKENGIIQEANSSLKQVKSDLNEALRIQSELEADLSAELLKLEKSQKLTNELLQELDELDKEVVEMEGRYQAELSVKNEELAQAKAKLNMLTDKLNEMKQKEQLFLDYTMAEVKLQKEVEALKAERETLQLCLAATLGNRFKNCWKNSLEYQKTTFAVFHWLAFYMLPATPPPKMTSFPISLSLQKAMSVLKR